MTFPGAAGTALPVRPPSLPSIMPMAQLHPWLLELLLGRAARWPLDEDSDDLALTAAK